MSRFDNGEESSTKVDLNNYITKNVAEQRFLNVSGDDKMQGSLDMNSFRIKNLSDPTDVKDAVPRSYIDSLTHLLVVKTAPEIRNYLNCNSNQIRNLSAPTRDNDAATKKYCDDNSKVRNSIGLIKIIPFKSEIHLGSVTVIKIKMIEIPIEIEGSYSRDNFTVSYQLSSSSQSNDNDNLRINTKLQILGTIIIEARPNNYLIRSALRAQVNSPNSFFMIGEIKIFDKAIPILRANITDV